MFITGINVYSEPSKVKIMISSNVNLIDKSLKTINESEDFEQIAIFSLNRSFL